MGWEQRGTGRYFYRKRRQGRRVVSEYVGTGELAELAAALDALAHIEREEEWEVWRQERKAQLDLDRQIDAAGDAVRAVTRAALLTTGHHTHKGTWRRRRE